VAVEFVLREAHVAQRARYAPASVFANQNEIRCAAEVEGFQRIRLVGSKDRMCLL
jgi:hypothetical protein